MTARSGAGPRRPNRALLLVAGLLAFPCLAGGERDDTIPEYPRRDPDNPGGDRVGDDDGADGFTGYPADAGEPHDPYYDPSAENRSYSPNWTGAYLGGGAFAGPTWAYGRLIDGTASGHAWGGFLDFSSLNHIAHFQLTYTRSSLDAEVMQEAVSLTRDSVAFSLQGHPLFIGIIGGDRISYTSAGWHVTLGGSAEHVSLLGDSIDHDYWAPAWHLGTGLDTWIDSPQDRGSFWVGVQYRWNNTSGDNDDARFRRLNIRDHTVMIRLSFRWNGNFGSGFPGPEPP